MNIVPYPNYYENFFIFCFPAGAGGNFLINCLSLSDDCVLRSSVLANAQLNNKFDINDKVQWIKNQIDKSRQENKWEDLELGCSNLMGVWSPMYVREFPEILSNKFDPIVTRLIDKKIPLCLVTHNVYEIPFIIRYWPNSRLVFFNNTYSFQQNRFHKKSNPRLSALWDSLKGPSWPIFPPNNLREFERLPNFIKQEFIENFGLEILRWLDYSEESDNLYHQEISKMPSMFPNNDYIFWDVEKNYKNFDCFIEAFVPFAQWAGIECPEHDVLKWYFDSWKSIIADVKG